MESCEVRDEGFADIMSQLCEYEKRQFLKIEIIGGNAVEDKRKEFRPGVIRQKHGSEFGNGIAELLGNRFELLGLEGGEEERLECGASRIGKSRPNIGELAAEENG